MSLVTNVILTYSPGECYGSEEGHPRLDEIAAYLRSHSAASRVAPRPFVPVDEHSGGYKHMENGVALGAFNFTSRRTILDAVAAAVWEYPDFVQVFIKEQHDDMFLEYTLKERRFYDEDEQASLSG